jgi:hypothetical protein
VDDAKRVVGEGVALEPGGGPGVDFGDLNLFLKRLGKRGQRKRVPPRRGDVYRSAARLRSVEGACCVDQKDEGFGRDGCR